MKEIASTALRKDSLAAPLVSHFSELRRGSPPPKELMLLLERSATEAGALYGVVTLHSREMPEPDVLAILDLDHSSAWSVATAVEQQIRSGLALAGTANPFLFHDRAETLTLNAIHDCSCATTCCFVGGTTMLALTLCTPQEPGEAQPPRKVGLGSSSVARWEALYLRLWWQAQAEQRRVGLLGKAFDLFNLATLLIEADGRIIFANEQANRLLDSGNGLRRSGPSVTATDFEDAVRLQTAIQHGIARPPASGGDSRRLPLVLLRRARAKPLVAAVFQLPVDGLIGGEPASVLYVLDPDSSDLGASTAAIGSVYGLTASEGTLVSHLVSGRTISEAAEKMRIRPDTARAYLKQIFVKTNTHRQADLVRVMLNSRLPIG